MNDRGGHSRTITTGVGRTGTENQPSPSRRAHAATAAGVFSIALLVYLLTVAPTVPFWDAGEYITTAATLGIPHPPGSPLLSLTGRVMSLLPLYDFRGGGLEHIAFRVNCIAVLSGAFSVLLLYLLSVRFITRFSPLTGRLRRDFPVFAAGAVSALTAGFAPQFWENAVEVETYLPSLMLSLL
ncbi:MAG TPA: DUF2723 domain-containing protein, partial [Armatimonadota bacterium]|nr:DUF2723 domain-containing protein [Armatimonadota bacterium]